MQSILEELNNDKLSEFEILSIVFSTSKHNVLLEVMKAYPDKDALILTIASNILTMTEYEYAKKNLNKELVSKLGEIMLDKISDTFQNKHGDIIDHCYAIRYAFGPDHNATKGAEKGIEHLGEAVSKYDRGKYSEYQVDEILHYMCGTYDGAVEAIDIIGDHPQWEGTFMHVYDDFNMLEEAIMSMNNGVDEESLEAIYEIATCIRAEEIGDSLELAKKYLPRERKLRKIIRKKAISNKPTKEESHDINPTLAESKRSSDPYGDDFEVTAEATLESSSF